MDTKRCLSCRKVLRADAHSCSRCGYVFSQAPARRNGNGTNGSRRSATVSFPSNPPASQHRAGHYSGFHPEDQPFQSSFMPVQRPPAITRRLVEEEPDEMLQPVVSTSSAVPQLTSATELPVPEQLSRRFVASPVPSPSPMPQRYPGAQAQMSVPVPQLQFVAPPLPPEPAWHEHITAPLPKPLYLPGKRHLRNRIVPILLITSCLFFLLATSILAFMLLGKRPVVSIHPVLIAAPSVMRVHDSFLLSGNSFQANEPVSLTRDVNIPMKDSAGKPLDVLTDGKGNFAIQIAITENWVVGQHSIYATDNVRPRATTTITVQPTPPTPPKLQLSASLIDFGANVLGAISRKTITLTNTGGGQIYWRSGSDSSWLTIAPGDDTFSGSEIATLIVNRTNLAPQAYTGYITFYQNGNNNTPLILTIKMTVNSAATTVTASPPPSTVTIGPPPVPVMVITTKTLAFSAIQGNNPAPQTFTIANTGNALLNWATTEDANAAAFAPLSPTRGVVAPGQTASISVKPGIASSSARVITGHITISDTDKETSIQSQQVTVTITISNQAVISVSSANLTFNNTSTTVSSSQVLTITNTGSAPLDWALSQSLPTWLSVDIPAGTLTPGTSTFVTVTCNSIGMTTGTYPYTLIVKDTDANTPVTPQNIQVTLTVT